MSAVLICLCWTTGLAHAAGPEIRPVSDGGKVIAFEAAGLPDGRLSELKKLAADDPSWSRVLAVYVGKEEGGKELPPMLGSYSLHRTAVRFTPKFPLRPGLSYCVVFYPPPARMADSPARYEKIFAIPAAARGAPAKIVAIYPSGSVLPENQLRLYVHFSVPMSRGEAYEHLQLLKADGEPVDLPFLEIGEELWDTSGKRLTLLIDPGRIKRGLKPREEAGPVLEAAGKYTLVIRKGWRDETGHSLAADFTKKFTAGPPIEKALETSAWKVAPPAAGSRGPLAVRFPWALDRALLERTITVKSASGKSVAGTIEINDNEHTWLFHPDQPWAPGKHELVVDTTLEDGAGNRIGRAFEVDVLTPVEKQVVAEFVRLSFEVAQPRK